MTLTYRYLIYPDGDEIEIDQDLRIDQMVDMNGIPLRLPLRSSKIIAYRVAKIHKRESRGEDNRYYHLELIPTSELQGMTI